MNQKEVLLSARELQVHFPVSRHLIPSRRKIVQAVNGIDLDVYRGETLGIVGESGCGKSTLARALLRLVEPTHGKLTWKGEDMRGFSKNKLTRRRQEFQMIFQDPSASLNPRLTISECIAEPLLTHQPQLKRAEVEKRVIEMMDKVGLLASQRNRYPHEFSGGQCQRVGIARALILNPDLVVCDEPVSALDVSIQAQVINLLDDLKQEMGLTLVMIAHDLSVVHAYQRPSDGDVPWQTNGSGTLRPSVRRCSASLHKSIAFCGTDCQSATCTQPRHPIVARRPPFSAHPTQRLCF